MKKLNKKAFTLIELLVVIAVIGILVLLGIPRFIGHTQKAELTRIQHDIKVMEQEVGTVLSTDDDFNKWEDNNKDLNQLIQEGKLFEKEGVVKKGEPIDGSYKVIPEKYKDKINTKLKGTFYANSGGKVYYEHLKSLSGIPTEPEEEPGYSDKEIEDLTNNCDFIPVATAEELNSIRNKTTRTYGKGTKWERECEGGLDKKYIQVRNVDLSEYSKEGWTPIGTFEGNGSEALDPNFTGTYDGGNYVITGLEVKGKGKEDQGLFGSTKGATIRNVGLENVNITGTELVGGLVGHAGNSTIENSYATGSVTGENSVGGLVGEAAGVSTTISNSYATVKVTGSVEDSKYLGGLVGYAWDSSTIENSYATGSVTGSVTDSWYVGGLVGRAQESNIENSYATGEVTGEDQVGGLVGRAYESSTIKNSYATGSVTGDIQVGGLVGMARDEAEISNSYATGSVTGEHYVGGLVGETHSSTIENSYATGSVTGSEYTARGLVGLALGGSTISNSYWDIEATGQDKSHGGGTGKSTDEMKQEATFSGWNFDTVWEIDEGKDYPTLR